MLEIVFFVEGSEVTHVLNFIHLLVITLYLILVLKVMLKVPVVVRLEGTNVVKKEQDLTLLFNF